jgi:short-subunit dehydrogenase
MSSSNKKIIIIGATSGIGRAVAGLYAERGCTLGVTGRRSELLREVQQVYPSLVHTECFDVTGNNNIKHLESLLQKTGGMDILIYNSGYGEVSKTLDWKLDKKMVDINVNGFVEITNYAFNYFMKQGHGQLVTTSSIAAIRGNSHAPAYSAGKAFQSIYFEGLYMKAKKLKANIYITDIQPGFVDTKQAKAGKLFWVAPVMKAAKQIVHAIDHHKRKAYITKRWWLIAQLLKIMPSFILSKVEGR